MAKSVPDAFEELDDVHAYAAQAKAQNTRRAYEADWRDFEAYLKKRGRPSLPVNPDDVARYLRYLVERRKLKVATVSRRLAAISERHKANGHFSPADEWVVKNTLRRLRVEHGSPSRGKAPLLSQELKRIMGAMPDTLTGTRDRAILLLGFAGAMRRHELVSLDVEDLALAPEGLVVSINKSKTDQISNGRKIGIPYGRHEATCPVRAVLRWLDESRIPHGPLFRGVTRYGAVRATRLTDQIVADVVKRYAKVIGKYAGRFSAHSLRAGFITSAAIAGVPERSIQDQSGHQSVTVLRRYIRDACIFRFNAASKVGL
jgi:site-specific recombinase XerD